MKNIKWISGIRIALATLLVANSPTIAFASSVSLIPTLSILNLDDGDIVSFEVAIDFSDVLNPDNTIAGTLGGGFDVIYDPLALDFVDVIGAGLGDPALYRDPDVPPASPDGLLESWGVTDFDGLSIGNVGTVRFQVLPGMGLSTLVALGPTTGIAGPWVSNVDFVTILQPEYASVELIRAPVVIPLPGALWLFGSALLGIIGFAKVRRRR